MEMSQRFSMNTSLKNAMIFEYDSDDDKDDYSGKTIDAIIKQEPMEKNPTSEKFTPLAVKSEPSNQLIPPQNIKREKIETSEEGSSEMKIEYSNLFAGAVKKEPLEDDKCGISLADLMLKTPVKIEPEEGKLNLKSTKRSLLKPRNSPYSKEKPAPSTSPVKRPHEDRFPRYNKSSKIPKREEDDKAVLERRQKQIDFGKNTIGYDNYVKQIPKNERKPEDPMTPNKYRVYSRRGFDGLIKQWRLQLHKYDP